MKLSPPFVNATGRLHPEASSSKAPCVATPVNELAPVQLRLNVQSLTDADIGKVATFLRIGRDRLRCDWRITFAGELDVLMLGTAEAVTVRGMLDDPLATLHLVDPHTAQHDAPGCLVRPLQYEPFIETLCELERRLGGRFGASADAPETPRIAPTQAGPNPVPRRTKLPPPGTGLRLRRWPAQALLQGDRDRARLASFLLSTRQIDLEELERLSNVGRPECEAFVNALIAADMLEVTPVAAPLAAKAPSTAIDTGTRQAPGRTRSFNEGLLGKIRRGLGLTWRR